jgi:hypothetical protein
VLQSDAGTTIIRKNLEMIAFNHYGSGTTEIRMEGETERIVSREQRSPLHHHLAPASQNEHIPWLQHRHRCLPIHLYLLFLALTCCCSFASATYLDPSIRPSPRDKAPELIERPTPLSRRLNRSLPILVDQRPPPAKAAGLVAWNLATEDDDIDLGLQRRQTSNPFGTDPIQSPTPSTKGQTKGQTTAAMLAPTTTTVTRSAVATTASPLPSALDSGIGTNFTTQSCPNFLSGFLANSTFKSCLPFSLFLQVSLPLVHSLLPPQVQSTKTLQHQTI